MSVPYRAALASIVLLGLILAGCGPSYIKNTEIEDTAENRAVLKVVERYRRAVELRDRETIKDLLSEHYYENASTTDTDEDDYGRDGVVSNVLPMLGENVDKVFYHIKITRITRSSASTLVDYEFVLKFRFTDGENEQWALHNDVNRIELVREQKAWKIRSGM